MTDNQFNGRVPKPTGRPPYQPTAEHRKQVCAMASYGVTQVNIAECFGISYKTLVKYYGDDLKTAATRANAKVAASLFRKAVSPQLTSPAVTAAIFWLKTRAQWKETTVNEHSGPGGGPVKVDLSGISNEKLDAVESLLTALAGATGGAVEAGEGGEGSLGD